MGSSCARPARERESNAEPPVLSSKGFAVGAEQSVTSDMSDEPPQPRDSVPPETPPTRLSLLLQSRNTGSVPDLKQLSAMVESVSIMHEDTQSAAAPHDVQPNVVPAHGGEEAKDAQQLDVLEKNTGPANLSAEGKEKVPADLSIEGDEPAPAKLSVKDEQTVPDIVAAWAPGEPTAEASTAAATEAVAPSATVEGNDSETAPGGGDAARAEEPEGVKPTLPAESGTSKVLITGHAIEFDDDREDEVVDGHPSFCEHIKKEAVAIGGTTQKETLKFDVVGAAISGLTLIKKTYKSFPPLGPFEEKVTLGDFGIGTHNHTFSPNEVPNSFTARGAYRTVVSLADASGREVWTHEHTFRIVKNSLPKRRKSA